MHIDLKGYIAAAIIAGLASLMSKTVREWVCAKAALMARYAYAWLLALPQHIDLSKLTPEARARFLRGYQHIVLGLVMIEEALLPDAGLGAERKTAVIKRLELLGVPEAIADKVPDLIEGGVAAMDKEAQAFIAADNPDALASAAPAAAAAPAPASTPAVPGGTPPAV